MSTLTVFVGPAATGKTWAARKEVVEHDAYVLDRRTFQHMVYGCSEHAVIKTVRKLEEKVDQLMWSSVLNILRGGWNVIVDDQNLTADERSMWAALVVDEPGVECRFRYFWNSDWPHGRTKPESFECLDRDQIAVEWGRSPEVAHMLERHGDRWRSNIEIGV